MKKIKLMLTRRWALNNNGFISAASAVVKGCRNFSSYQNELQGAWLRPDNFL
jgi:hypothetical protein